MAKTHVTMKVNGAEVEGLVEPRTLLVHFIRENLAMTGTHIGCETTHCGGSDHVAGRGCARPCRIPQTCRRHHGDARAAARRRPRTLRSDQVIRPQPIIN